MSDYLAAALEIKAIGDAATGEFSGYGAVYHTTDLIGDRLLPGVFAETLAERKALGRPLPMHFNHGLAELGGERGVGVWNVVEEDGNGLRVEGKIAGMGTERGRYYFERLRDGAISGLSIGFKVKQADYGRGAGQPRRTIKSAMLGEISIVDDPCHPSARILAVKSRDALHDLDEFKSRLAAGEVPTVRDFERLLRDAMGMTRAQAETVAGFGWKTLVARESGGEAKTLPSRAALDDLGAALAGFSLPTFR